MFRPRSLAQRRRQDSSSSEDDPGIPAMEAICADTRATTAMQDISLDDIELSEASLEASSVADAADSEVISLSQSSVDHESPFLEALEDFRSGVSLEKEHITAIPGMMVDLQERLVSEQRKLNAFAEALKYMKEYDIASLKAKLSQIQKDYPKDYKLANISAAILQINNAIPGLSMETNPF